MVERWGKCQYGVLVDGGRSGESSERKSDLILVTEGQYIRLETEKVPI